MSKLDVADKTFIAFAKTCRGVHCPARTFEVVGNSGGVGARRRRRPVKGKHSSAAMVGLRAKASAFEHPKAPHLDVLRARHFTAAMQMVFPAPSGAPETGAALTDVSGALRDACGASTSGTDGGARGFYVAHMALADLLDEGFLATHVKADGARLHALSADGRIDRDDVAAVTPNGQMHLSLTPRAYRRLGVSGLKSDDGTLKRRSAVNLAKKTFAPGGAFRDRLVEVARGLRATDCALAAKRPYLVTKSHRTSGGVERVVFPEGCAFSERRASLASTTVARERATPLAPASFVFGKEPRDAQAEQETLSDFHEWLGEVSCAETAEVRGTAAGTSRVERHRWEGFFVPDDVIAALAFCRRVVAVGAQPWAALTAWGFPDDPSRETALDAGGDGGGLGGGEHVTFVVVPGDGYVMYTQTGR